MKGELPEGWEWKRLGDILKFSRNGANLQQDKSGNGIPISRIETISYGIVDPTKVGYTQESDANIIQKCKLIEGDLLFSHINSLEHIGKTAIYENNPPVLLHGINLLLLRPDIKIVDPKFLHILFKKYRREKKFWSMANKAVNQASINQSRLNEIEIPLPPLPVQRQIVAVLEQAEVVKRQRQEADALTGALLQSVFSEMFGDPVRNERGWGTKNFEDGMSAIIDYRGKTPTKTKSGIPLVTAKIVKDGKILPPEEFISPDDYDSWMRRGIPQKGDVILTTEGPLGTVAQLHTDEKLAFAQRLIILRGKPEILDNTYLSHFFKTDYYQNQLKSKATGSTVEGISQGNLRETSVRIPPLSLQQQFASVVESVERIREQQVESGKEIEGLCEGLMARAFRGELVA